MSATFDICDVPPGQLPEGDLVALYAAVGWTTYSADPQTLRLAIRGSGAVVAAYGDERELIGLSRAITDGVTICYLQDILVLPAWQRHGVGRALLSRQLHKHAGLRQFVLLTDNEPAQRAFYESAGLVEAAEAPGGPLRCFLRLGATVS